MNIINAKDIQQQHLTVLIYGTPGMGKTSLLGNLPGRTLILDFDRGTSVLAGCEHVDIARVPINNRDIWEAVNELKASCPYDNVALDSFSELERAILGNMAANNSLGIPTKQDYGKINIIMHNVCRQMRDINANIFFTAWEQYTDIIAPNGDKYSRIEPLIRDKNMSQVTGLCDIVGRIYLDLDTQTRRVWLEGRPNVVAKDRVFKRQSCNFEEVIHNGTMDTL